MLNIGGGEFLVIFLVALIVLGPTKLPEAARQMGNILGEFRRISSGFQSELKGALNDPVERATRDLSSDVASVPVTETTDHGGEMENSAPEANEPSANAPDEADEPPMYGDR
jgi:sec-independent protein translocase protein TatB